MPVDGAAPLLKVEDSGADAGNSAIQLADYLVEPLGDGAWHERGQGGDAQAQRVQLPDDLPEHARRRPRCPREPPAHPPAAIEPTQDGRAQKEPRKWERRDGAPARDA